MTWQPIETAPANREILVFQSKNKLTATARGMNELGDWKTGPGPMDFIAGVTHWQPLPEPPCD